MNDPIETKFVVSFIQFIRQKVSAGQCSEDQIEGLEVATQCLEAAFGITDASYAFQPSKPLVDIFRIAEGFDSSESEMPEPTDDEKATARKLKEEGNELMKAEKYVEAVQKYNEAIKIHRDPVYFCNRAAAYCKMEQYDLAIQDCRTSLALDPAYSKAYGRMGLALSCQNLYEQAVEAYNKALELEPNQESYQNNLKIAQDKVRENEQSTRQAPTGAQMPFGGGIDLNAMLNNPAMIDMATQMMSDPGMQNMFSGMMNNVMGQQGGQQGIGSLIEAGQRLAQSMQNQQPEVLERLRQQFGAQQAQGGSDENNSRDSTNEERNSKK